MGKNKKKGGPATQPAEDTSIEDLQRMAAELDKETAREFEVEHTAARDARKSKYLSLLCPC